MKASLIILLFLLLKCSPSHKCNQDYFQMDDEYPDEAISENGYTKSTVYVDEIDSNFIMSEANFNSSGQTIQIINYLQYKPDSFAIKHLYKYNKRNPKQHDEYYELKNSRVGTFTIDRETGEETESVDKFVYDTVLVFKDLGGKGVRISYKDKKVISTEEHIKDDCGYDKSYNYFDENKKLLYFSKFEIDPLGRIMVARMYDSSSTLIGVKKYEYHGNTFVFKRELFFEYDELVTEKITSINNSGMVSEEIEKNYSDKTSYKIIIEYAKGLIDFQEIQQYQNDSLMHSATLFYRYE